MAAFSSNSFSIHAFSIHAFDFGAQPSEQGGLDTDKWQHRRHLTAQKRQHLREQYYKPRVEKAQVSEQSPLVETLAAKLRFKRRLDEEALIIILANIDL